VQVPEGGLGEADSLHMLGAMRRQHKLVVVVPQRLGEVVPHRLLDEAVLHRLGEAAEEHRLGEGEADSLHILGAVHSLDASDAKVLLWVVVQKRLLPQM
jgi:hypothetical protein